MQDGRASEEKIRCAEKLLQERRILKRSSEEIQKPQRVEEKYLNFTAYNLRNKTDLETVTELVNRGLNKSTAENLVLFYHQWKTKQKKRLKIWYVIAAILIPVGLYLELWSKMSEGFILFLIPLIGIGYSSISITNFKKLVFFKTIDG